MLLVAWLHVAGSLAWFTFNVFVQHAGGWRSARFALPGANLQLLAGARDSRSRVAGTLSGGGRNVHWSCTGCGAETEVQSLVHGGWHS